MYLKVFYYVHSHKMKTEKMGPFLIIAMAMLGLKDQRILLYLDNLLLPILVVEELLNLKQFYSN